MPVGEVPDSTRKSDNDDDERGAEDHVHVSLDGGEHLGNKSDEQRSEQGSVGNLRAADNRNERDVQCQCHIQVDRRDRPDIPNVHATADTGNEGIRDRAGVSRAGVPPVFGYQPDRGDDGA